MASAPGEPPGSRVTTTPRPKALRRSASKVAWVDFPVPSPPSKVMKRPRNGPPRNLRSDSFSAGAEQPDDEFAGGVEGTLGQVSLWHGIGRLQRDLEHDVVAARHPQLPDELALLHRRRHRS